MFLYKVIVTFPLLCLFISATAQNIQFNTDSSSYQISDTTLTGAKSDLHRKAQGWVIDKFKDSKKAIRLDDMDTGELIGKGTLDIKGGQTSSFTFKVSSRDRAYTCEIYDIGISSAKDTALKQYASLPSGNDDMKKTATRVDASIRSLLKDLHKRMKTEKDFSKPSPAPLD